MQYYSYVLDCFRNLIVRYYYFTNIPYIFVVGRLRGVTGDLLLEIKRMQQTAPEAFYSAMRTDLQLDFLSILKFTRALAAL